MIDVRPLQHSFGIGDVVRMRFDAFPKMLVVDVTPTNVVAAWQVGGAVRERRLSPGEILLHAKAAR